MLSPGRRVCFTRCPGLFFCQPVRFPVGIGRMSAFLVFVYYFTSQMSLVSSNSAKVWYFLAAFTSSICAVTQSS